MLHHRVVVFVAVFFIALRYVFIGDSSFVNDESKLLSAALDANGQGVWATSGLLGSRGITYAPVAVWVYQLLLSISLNPITILLFKITLDTLLLCAALLGLSRLSLTRGFPELVWVVPLSSPYFWFYARSLWDNTFVIGFVALSLFFYLSFLERGHHLRFALAALLAALAVSFHLMALPWAAALFMHGLLCSPGMRRERIAYRLPTILLFTPIASYYLLQNGEKGVPTLNLSLSGVEGAVLGLRSMIPLGIEYLTGSWLDTRSGLLLLGVRLLGVVLGVPLLIFSLVALWRQVKASSLEGMRSPRGAIYLTIALHALLAFAAGLHTHPQYFNAVWIFYLLALGFFLAGTPRRFALLAVRSALVANALTICAILFLAHVNLGIRSVRYGASIAEKWRIAREINVRSSASSVEFPDQIAPFPHAFLTLIALDRAARPEHVTAHPLPLVLGWRHPDAALNCELELRPSGTTATPLSTARPTARD